MGGEEPVEHIVRQIDHAMQLYKQGTLYKGRSNDEAAICLFTQAADRFGALADKSESSYMRNQYLEKQQLCLREAITPATHLSGSVVFVSDGPYVLNAIFLHGDCIPLARIGYELQLVTDRIEAAAQEDAVSKGESLQDKIAPQQTSATDLIPILDKK